MNTSSRPGQALQQFLAAPEGRASQADSVSSNPILLPGIRLMGSVSFAAKALVICLVFLVPLLWVTWKFQNDKGAAISFSAKELLGVQYNREIFPALDLAQQMRRESVAIAAGGASTSLPDIKTQLNAAMAKIEAVDKQLGAELGSSSALAAVHAARAEAEKATDAGAVFAAHTAHVESLLALLTAVTDGSNLTLDPDIDSYYVMDAALFRAADIIEQSAKLRGLGLSVMKTGSATPEQRSSLAKFNTLGEFQFKSLQDGLAKALAYNKDLGAKLDTKQTLEDTQAFYALMRKSLLEGEDFAPETQAAYLAAANKAIGSQYAFVQTLISQLDELVKVRVADMRNELHITYLILGLGLALAVYMFYCFYLVSNSGMQQLSQHLIEMADGDLRSPPGKQWAKDEPALLLGSMKNTYDALHALIKKVRHGARALHAASGEIASASMDLGGRTEHAASALEEQAAAMEEIGIQVKSTADLAQMAASFAVENSHVAQRGGQVFSQVVTTMQEIKGSSTRIGDIISVIDGIAFQTNILALNAAVEAARAGEAGRGFAVVASEVRSLAGRSAEAAREIKSLISASVSNVESGTKVVEDAGKTMSDLVANAQKITGFLDGISTAAKEQAIGVQEVATAIQDLDRNTQQNAALVEQTMAAAASLTGQADTLQEEIANFRVV